MMRRAGAAPAKLTRGAVFGHRGARGLFPENTLEGFQAAAALGVAAFELDVGMTADGLVVVHHDPALNPDIARDPSGAWLTQAGPLIWSLTAAELARYDVGRLMPGSPTSLSFPDQRPHDGARVPTLLSVLTALPDVAFIIEVKTDPAHPGRTAPPAALADAVLAVVDRAAAAERVVVESFDWEVSRRVRRVRPEIAVAWLTRPDASREQAPWRDRLNPASGPGPACATGTAAAPPLPAQAAAGCPFGDQTWAPHYAGLTEPLVREAHGHGFRVVPWTVNLPKDMERLIDWQVDGLVSDRPDLALTLIGADPAE